MDIMHVKAIGMCINDYIIIQFYSSTNKQCECIESQMVGGYFIPNVW